MSHCRGRSITFKLNSRRNFAGNCGRANERFRRCAQFLRKYRLVAVTTPMTIRTHLGAMANNVRLSVEQAKSEAGGNADQADSVL